MTGPPLVTRMDGIFGDGSPPWAPTTLMCVSMPSFLCESSPTGQYTSYVPGLSVSVSVALEPGWISNRQIEAARVALTRHIKRGGKVWIRIFPDKPITKKPAETRMGKGKGSPEGWVAVVKPGRVLFELEGVTREIAGKAMALAAAKMPVRTKFVAREEAHTDAG